MTFSAHRKDDRFFLEWCIKLEVANKNVSIWLTNAPIRRYFMHLMLSCIIRMR